MNPTKSIARNSFFLLSGQAISKLISLVTYALIARFLGPANSGKFLAGLAFVGIFLVIIDWNMHLLLIREVSRDKNVTKSFFNAVIRLKLILSIPMILAVAVVSYFFYSGDSLYIIWLLTPAIILMNLSLACTSIFKAFEKMQFDATQMVIRSFLFLVFVIGIKFFNLGIIFVALAFLLSEAIIFIFNLFIYLKYFASYSKEKTKEIKILNIFKEAVPLGLAFLFATVYLYLDTVLLSLLKGDVEAGYYGISYRLIMAVIVFPAMISMAFYPIFSQLYVENKKKLKRLYFNAIKVLLTLTLPISVGGTFLGTTIIVLYAGDKFIGAGKALEILVWIILLNALTYMTSHLIIAIHKQKLLAYIAAFAMIFNAVFDIILIPRFGMIGAGIVAVATELVVLLCYMGVIKKFLIKKIRFNYIREIIGPFFSVFIMGIFVYLFKDKNIFIIVPLAALVYTVALFLTKTVNRQDILYIKNILKLKESG